MKIIHYYLCASLLFMASCSKNSQKPASQQINSDLVSEVENLGAKVSAQKLSYQLLNPDEKLALWQNQLDYYLSSDLNESQKDALRTLKAGIKREMFTQTHITDKSYDAFAQAWYNSATKVFAKNVLNTIVSQIHTKEFALDYVSAINAANSGASSQLVINSLTPMNEKPKACTCSTGSDYCSQFYQCSSTFFKCESSSMGCGFMLLYSCDGTCVSGA